MSDAPDPASPTVQEIERLLSRGLSTEWRERASTGAKVNEVVARLQAEAAGDVPAKLRIAGFTLTPYVGEDPDIAQACESCMYFVVHRQRCDLPELRLPVKPQWSCRLWRI